MNWLDEIEKDRQSLGLSNAQYALALGVSKQFLSQIQLGQRPIPEQIKLQIWEKNNWRLNLENVLSFIPEKVQEEILEVSKDSKGGAKPKPLKDWPDLITSLRKDMGLPVVAFAQYLGVSQPLLSYFTTGRRETSWPLKVTLWKMAGAPFTRQAMLVFLADDVRGQLLRIEAERE